MNNTYRCDFCGQTKVSTGGGTIGWYKGMEHKTCCPDCLPTAGRWANGIEEKKVDEAPQRKYRKKPVVVDERNETTYLKISITISHERSNYE